MNRPNSGVAFAPAQPPANKPADEPAILEVAVSVLKWQDDLGVVLLTIYAKLKGTEEQIPDRPAPRGLEEMLRTASTNAASLVGLARTIDSLLGE